MAEENDSSGLCRPESRGMAGAEGNLQMEEWELATIALPEAEGYWLTVRKALELSVGGLESD